MKKSKHSVYKINLAVVAGVEPTNTESKSVVLPLHHTTIYAFNIFYGENGKGIFSP